MVNPPTNAAEYLAEATGEPKEKFEPEDPEYPELGELETVPVDEFECPCGCTDE